MNLDSETALALGALVIAPLLLAVVCLIKNVEPDWRTSYSVPLTVGVLCGAAVTISGRWLSGSSLLLEGAVLLTLAAGLIYRNASHLEPLEGFLGGGITGSGMSIMSILIPARHRCAVMSNGGASIRSM